MFRMKVKVPIEQEIECEWIETKGMDSFEFAMKCLKEIREAISDKYEAQIKWKLGLYDKNGDIIYE